jgi:hypothetical protein
MVENETIWFSQMLLYYKDKNYGTDGQLRLSISSNTQDYKFFNPPNLSISISTNYQKNFNLPVYEASALLKAFEEALSNKSEKIEVQRRDSKGTILYFSVGADTSTGEKLVSVQIRSNEADFTKVVVPLKPIFEVFLKALRYFVDKYFDICSTLLAKSIDSDIHLLTQQLPGLIKGISGQIISTSSIPTKSEFIAASKTETTIKDLDNFLGPNMENIKVAELDIEKKEQVYKIDSKFVTDILKNDLSTLENMLSNHVLQENPIASIIEDVKKNYSSKNEDFILLPDVKDIELRSMFYISKLLYTIAYQKYYYNQEVIPISVPILKYNPTKKTEDNVSIAMNLFVLGAYIRTLRRRLETKISDSYENKSVFYLSFRCFLDPFIFSFIGDIEHLNSVCVPYYLYFNNIGVFNKYKQLLKENGCPDITENDIVSYATEVMEKGVMKSRNILDLHEHLRNIEVVKLTTKNEFTLEQIINEIIPLEVFIALGRDITNEVYLNEFVKEHNISSEIVQFFIGKKKKSAPKKDEEKPAKRDSNLLRFMKEKEAEIPGKYRSDFQKVVEALGTKAFDFKSFDFQYIEFGDNVIKALYNWNPPNDSRIITDYSYFCEKIKDEIMSKESILASISIEEKKDNGWGMLLE